MVKDFEFYNWEVLLVIYLLLADQHIMVLSILVVKNVESKVCKKGFAGCDGFLRY